VTSYHFYNYFPHDVRRIIFALTNPGKFKKLQYKRKIDAAENDYSLKSFDEHQCIFVHIPKAAGVSICRSLFGNLAGGHTPMKTYELLYSKKTFDSYFKFTFVRNPWDRLFSAYYFLKAGGLNETDKRWSVDNLGKYENFEEFILYGIRGKNILAYTHFRPQLDFLRGAQGKKPLVDFWGFYENLQNDFKIIQKRIFGDSLRELLHLNKAKASQTPCYKECYTDDMKRIVESIYQDDISLFGYNFENTTINQQIENRNQRFQITFK
jgi:hypothetical protein